MTTTIHHGDCLDVLRSMPDNSVDAVVCDPPYGLSNTTPDKVTDTIVRWAQGDREHVPTGKGFMGASWDAFVPPAAAWDECLRVLKPGGHLVAFAGSRTQDLMGLAIRLAGFDIRENLAWLYGSGFPKSMDVSKAIDKTGGASPEAQGKTLKAARERAGMTREDVAAQIGCSPATVRNWEEGRPRRPGTLEVITPSEEFRTKLADLLGYTADERRIVGVAQASRSLWETGHRGIQYGDPTTPEAEKWQGWGTALKPAHEPIILARKPFPGTVAANTLEWGTGGLNIDSCRIGTDPGYSYPNGAGGTRRHDVGLAPGGRTEPVQSNPGGRWPANVVLDDTTAPALDEQSEGASRFFKVAEPDVPFMYAAKAPKRERPSYVAEDGQVIQHSTVKPVSIMKWLCRLTCPPGGVILDPFAGSGTTVEAAILEGFNVIGIEREAAYLPLIQQRIDRATPPSPEPAEETLLDLLGDAA